MTSYVVEHALHLSEIMMTNGADRLKHRVWAIESIY